MSSLVALGAYATACGLAYVSALVPLVNAEALVLIYAAVAGGGTRQKIAVAFFVALGQMIGKVTLYWAGRGAAKVPSERQRKAIERWGNRFSRSRTSVLTLVFISAFVGIPPFYAISLLCGTFRVNLVAFFAVGLVGRFLRFGILTLFPGLLGWHR